MKKIKKNLSGVLTVELSILFMIIFSIFVLIVYTVFYYHDKNILLGAASETAVLCAQLERKPNGKEELNPETFYQERIAGKLILFANVSVNMSQSDEKIIVSASAQKGTMKVKVRGTAIIVKPEEQIRKKRVLEDWTEQEG